MSEKEATAMLKAQLKVIRSLEGKTLAADLRVGNGLPREVDEVRALGNAVVPQIPEIIGNAILGADQEKHYA